MFNRIILLSLAVAGLSLVNPVARCHADVPAAGSVHLALFADDENKSKMNKNAEADDEKDGDEKDDHHEGKEAHEKEIETAVPMNMIPQAVLDAVKKEVPNGKITEAELEVKHGKIMYGFDVKDGDMTYDVNITVDGKFFSKKVDDEKDEQDEKQEKKPASAAKM